MASEIGLCRKIWKYRSKKSLPQIALHRYWNSNFTHFIMSQVRSFLQPISFSGLP
jgi:hypothetical protein